MACGGGFEVFPSNQFALYDVGTLGQFFKQHTPFEFTDAEAELKNPTPDLVFVLYRWLLRGILGCEETELDQPPFDADHALDPELYLNGQQKVMLLIAVNNILKEVGFSSDVGFDMGDLLHPKPRKTRMILSCLVSIYEMVLEKKPFIDKLKSKMESQKLDRVERERRLEVLEDKVGQLRRMKLNQEQHSAELQRYHKNLKDLLEERAQQAEPLKRGNAELESLALSEGAAKEERKRVKEKLEEELRRLDAHCQIVTSPEKLESEMGELKEQKDHNFKIISDYRERVDFLQQRQKELELVDEKLEDLMKRLSDCEELKVKIDEKKAQAVEKEDELDKVKRQLAEATRERDTQLETYLAKRTQLDKQQRRHQGHLKDLQEKLQRKETEVEELKGRQTKLETTGMNVERQIRETKLEMENIRRQRQSMIASLDASEQKMFAELGLYVKDAQEFTSALVAMEEESSFIDELPSDPSSDPSRFH